MDLCDPKNEACYHFLVNTIEADASKTKNLAYKIYTSELYALYKRQCENPVSLEDFWSIIRIVWPFVEIIGPKGYRQFTGVRKR